MKLRISLSSPVALVKQMCQQMTHMPKDIKEVKVGTKIHVRAKQKDCFNNAWRHISDHLDDVYVLGYVLVQGIPLEHAWVRRGNDYLDVTLNSDGQEGYVAVTEVPIGHLVTYVFKNHHAPDMYGYEVMLRKKK